MPRVLLALGSNLGDRGATLDAAVAAIGDLSVTQVMARSKWHATRPVGGPPGQGEFLNGAVFLETAIQPAVLRHELQQIEQQLGRERTERWAARPLDIDILLYDDRVIDEPDLQVPHPRMSFRPFVLAPAAEIAADMIHPAFGVSIGALWHHLQHAEDVVVMCGGVADDRRRLVEDLLCRFPSQSFASLSTYPTSQWQLFPALRIRDNLLAPDLFMQEHYRHWVSGREPDASLPKLQIFFALPQDQMDEYLHVHGGLHDHDLWNRCQGENPAPNPMSCLFTAIPTLTLDPRSDPADQLTEAAAALVAVWPDLCRQAS